MRVLFYHSDGVWSGSARVFAATARVLATRGYQVLYACPPDSEVEERVARSGVEVVPIETRGAWAPESRRLRRVLVERFVEAVFVHTEREHLVAAAATRWAERGAVVRRTPAGGVLEYGASSRLALRLASGGFLFTSEGERQRAPRSARALDPLVADLGVDVSAYDAVQPAAPRSLGVDGGERLLVCVCDPRARARAATVLRSVAMLAPRHPELRLVLVGQGSDHEDLRMHAAALGITPVVRHLGQREDEVAVLRAADIGWVIADHDDAALGVLDFMALRVPVLADRGTVSERYVADAITGTLLQPADAPATAAIVARLLAHDRRRTAMGNAGRTRVARDFTEAAMVDGVQRALDAARDRTSWVV